MKELNLIKVLETSSLVGNGDHIKTEAEGKDRLEMQPQRMR